MKPIRDPAKESKEAKSYEKHPKRPPREAKAAEPPTPPTNVKAEDDRLTPEQVEQRFKFFDVKDVPDSFFAIVCAPRRNGKSEMLQSMLEDFRACKERKFSHIFLFSQTGVGYEQQIPPTYRFQDLTHLPEICRQQLQVQRYNKKAKRKEDRVTSRVLCILDDMIAEEKGPQSLKNNKMIRSLAVGGRHLGSDGVEGNGISVIILTQSMKAIPKVVRQQADFCACGKLASRIERETYVYEQLALRSDREGIKQAYAVFDGIAYSAPYRFIICCNWIQTRMSHDDYVTYYNANYPVKQHHMFGDKSDWLEEETPPSIFDLEM